MFPNSDPQDNLVFAGFHCIKGDPYLFKVLILFYHSLVELKGVNISDLEVQECETHAGFYYKFTNSELNLDGYIGRNMTTREVVYLIVDKSRVKWAEDEGFIEHGWDLKQVWEKIGVMRQARTMNDLVKFVMGAKGFELKGNYITE